SPRGDNTSAAVDRAKPREPPVAVLGGADQDRRVLGARPVERPDPLTRLGHSLRGARPLLRRHGALDEQRTAETLEPEAAWAGDGRTCRECKGRDTQKDCRQCNGEQNAAAAPRPNSDSHGPV